MLINLKIAFQYPSVVFYVKLCVLVCFHIYETMSEVSEISPLVSFYLWMVVLLYLLFQWIYVNVLI